MGHANAPVVSIWQQLYALAVPHSQAVLSVQVQQPALVVMEPHTLLYQEEHVSAKVAISSVAPLANHVQQPYPVVQHAPPQPYVLHVKVP